MTILYINVILSALVVHHNNIIVVAKFGYNVFHCSSLKCVSMSHYMGFKKVRKLWQKSTNCLLLLSQSVIEIIRLWNRLVNIIEK